MSASISNDGDVDEISPIHRTFQNLDFPAPSVTEEKTRFLESYNFDNDDSRQQLAEINARHQRLLESDDEGKPESDNETRPQPQNRNAKYTSEFCRAINYI